MLPKRTSSDGSSEVGSPFHFMHFAQYNGCLPPPSPFGVSPLLGYPAIEDETED